MAFHINQTDNFWAEAVNTACHAINRLYLHKIYKKAAYELLTGNKPKVDYFRVFVRGNNCILLGLTLEGSYIVFVHGPHGPNHIYSNKTEGRSFED